MKVRVCVITGIITIVMLMATLFVQRLAAQPHTVRFQHLTLDDERWQGRVYDMLQDRVGFLWFGTRDGLYRYDGYTLIPYQNDPDDPYSLGGLRVRTIHEDRLGNLWIGLIDGGLNRFDRQRERFIRYQHDPADSQTIASNDVRVIFEDSEGALWIGTEGGGINRFDRDTQQFIRYPHNDASPQALSGYNVTVIMEDRAGNLWIGTKDGGLNRLDRASGHIVQYQHHDDDPHSLGDNDVLAIVEDASGTLWVGTRKGGLGRFHRESGHFTNYQHNPHDPFSLSASRNGVYSIAEDRTGKLWIGTLTGGINRFDRETERFIHYESTAGESIYTILEDRNGELWMGGLRQGVYWYDRQRDKFLNYAPDANDPDSLSYPLVWDIYEDRSGGLWFGTWGGINFYHPITAQFGYYANRADDPSSLSHNGIQSIHESSSGTIWLGTTHGLNRWERESLNFTHYFHNDNDPHSLSGNHLGPVYQDRGGTLWVGTLQDGLNACDPETMRCVHYQHDDDHPDSLIYNFIKDIYEDRTGLLWVGTQRGLDRFDRRTQTFHHYQHDPRDSTTISHNSIVTMYEDRQGTLWIGTGHGLNRFDRQHEQFVRYEADPRTPHSVSNDTILSLYEDRQGRFWIGTDGGGLNRFNRQKGTFIHYRKKHGLPSDSVYGILEDGAGNLWLSTKRGISKFNPDAERFKNYDMRDGLQGNKFNARASCKTHDGQMLFGGINGLTTFYPEDIHDNPYKPPVVLTDFQVFNRSVHPSEQDDALLRHSITYTDAITLSHRDYVISFEFAALNYVLPEKNRYAYRLEDFEQDWNVTSAHRRFVTYTNLPAGHYVFHVKAANNDGVWNEEGCRLAITVMPPWWKTTWFLGLLGGALLGLVIGGYRWRVRAIQTRNRLLEQQIAERTNALRESEEKYRSLAERANDGIVIIQDGCVKYSNPQLATLLGYSLEDLYEKHIDQLTCPQQRAMIRERYEHRIRGQAVPSQYETALLHKTGQCVDVEVNAGVMEFEGRPAILGIIRDIRERKQFQTELQQAKEAAEAANRAKSAFLANMSHELRTPLNGVLGYAQILKQDPQLQEQQRNGLNVIEQSGHHLLTLIDDVLDLAKIESGKLELYEDNFNLGELLQGVREMIRIRAEHHRVAFRCEFSDNLPDVVRGDEKRLRQVLLNLLSNAVKFTRQGWVGFRVMLIPSPSGSEAPWLRCEVEDTGVGITADNLATIFEPFQQVGSQAHRRQGTGLGLAISRTLVTLMQGRLDVRSQIGQGSLFWFEMPLKTSHAALAAPCSLRRKTGINCFRGDSQACPKILLVEDSDESRAILRAMLAPLGFELKEAQDGTHALEIIGAWLPDLVITDLRMPEMDGFELIRRLRQIPAFRGHPIIASSASVYEHDQQRSAEMGSDAFLPKPVQLEVLLQLLQELLDLEWEEEIIDIEKAPSAMEPLCLPPAAILNELHDLTQIGDIQRLRHYLKQLCTSHPAYRPFFNHLLSLAREFRINDLRSAVQHYYSNST